MIAFLKGEVVRVTENSVIINVGNIGYLVGIGVRDAEAMPPVGEEITLYTYMSVSQDAIALYGFLSADDLDMFKMLLKVSGVGPKVAVGVLSVLDANALRLAILSDDSKTISKAPGLGAKTAKKVILELKDKISFADAFPDEPEEVVSASGDDGDKAARQEAAEAMVSLGYSSSDALRAVRKAAQPGMSTEDIIRAALKNMI